MKEIQAIIQPFMLEKVLRVLAHVPKEAVDEDIQRSELSASEVLGCRSAS